MSGTHNLSDPEILRQQAECLRLAKERYSQAEISKMLGLSQDQVYRRIRGAKKMESLDPALADRLLAQGLTDFSGSHSGWLI